MTPSLLYLEIELNHGLLTKVDWEDFEWLSQWGWHAWKNNYSWFAARRNGKYQETMHRLIMGLQRGNPLQVDHVNHDTLDNRRGNLRVVTPEQNQRNRRTPKNNTTGYKGVFRDWRGMYRATIMYGGRIHSLGYRKTAEEAYALYVAAAKEHHGEFACFE